MKVIFHEQYRKVYSSDPASAPGRMEVIVNELKSSFKFVQPEKANEDDLRLVHWQSHIDVVKSLPLVYEVALLAVGGAVKSSEIAMQGEPAFGLIRPPGHHASQNSSWGFCFFNNIAISVAKLLQRNLVRKALIVDFDLHFGDGTANIFAFNPRVVYYHVEGHNREVFRDNLAQWLRKQKGFDIIAVSAGFDRHEHDWGGLLKTEDYEIIGKMIKEHAEEVCEGRRYAVFEGGYNQAVLGKNVKAFLEGFK
jgi:acetoin utilization deacetylase AcuC-like enzyme